MVAQREERIITELHNRLSEVVIIANLVATFFLFIFMVISYVLQIWPKLKEMICSDAVTFSVMMLVLVTYSHKLMNSHTIRIRTD